MVHCGVDGCRNPIRDGALGCWRHPDGVSTRGGGSNSAPARALDDAARRAALDSGLGMYGPSMWRPRLIDVGQSQAEARLMMTAAPIDRPVAEAVIDSLADLDRDHPLDIPFEVNTHLDHLVRRFESGMEERGIGLKRVTRLTLTGVNRVLPNGKVQNAGSATHTAFLIDRGQDSEVVVDPFMARLTPVRNPQVSVLAQYRVIGSLMNDIPTVASLRRYLRNDYIWFDNHRLG